MTTARSQTVPPDRAGAYHITSRCVRRAFLCGDAYEHRRGWVHDLIRKWAPSFTVEVLGFSVMSNHYHLVLKNDPRHARTWTPRQVTERWAALYPLKDDDGAEIPWPEEELERKAGNTAWVEVRRERLSGVDSINSCRLNSINSCRVPRPVP